MSNNFIAIIFEELEIYFSPLLEAAEEPEELFTFFEAIGWDLHTILGASNAPFVDAVQDVANGISLIIDIVENPPEDFGGLKTSLEATFNFINGIRNLDSFVVDSAAIPSSIGNLVKHLFQHLTAFYIYRKSRLAFHFLELLTLIRFEEDRETHEIGGTRGIFDSDYPIFDFGRIPDVLTEPHHLFEQEYWPDGFTDRNTTNKVARKLFRRIAKILVELGISARVGGNLNPDDYDPDLFEKMQGLLSLSKTFFLPDSSTTIEAGMGVGLLAETEGGPGVYIFPFGELTINQALGEWILTFNIGGAAGGLEFTGTGVRLVADPGTNRLESGLQLEKQAGEHGLALLVGSTTGTRFEIEKMGFGAGVVVNAQKKEYKIFSKLDKIKFVFSPGDGDGFLQETLSDDGFVMEFDLEIGYSNITGFHFKGSGGLEIRFAPHLELGPFTIEGLLIGLRIKESGALALVAGATVKLELGPFIAVVEELGLRADITYPDSGGNLGPVDFNLDFKPPTGVGLSLDTDTVRGGGYLFFDTENERYGGALELSIKDQFTVTAIALITTRFPDGSKGFSLLLIINVQFTPGIALGMGFFITGLGGLIGINRTIDVEAMRDGVKNNAIDHILFPENVVANIAQIITDIRAIFPPKRDQFIIGFMAKITWGVPTLLSIELGLVIEFANPVRIAILGVLKAIIPEENAPILKLQINFLGIIDFERGELAFDASLYNSKLLTFTLEGDMAIRLKWKDPKGFVLSIGGFHPAFEPPQHLNLRPMQRLTLTILPDNPRLVITNYFAITSNTVQFGAAIDFYFKISKFSVLGYFGFDVLFQFSPFMFIANIRAGVEVKMGSSTLLSIKLAFELQGPTPWKASGTASFKILFIKIKVKFSKTWGEKKDTALPPAPVLPKVIEALQQDKNWQGQLPSRRFLLVSLKKEEAGVESTGLLLQSFSSLSIRQNVIPLDIVLTKFGNFRPQDVKKIRITELLIGSESIPFDYIKESFAPSIYKEMSDDDKLKAPSYQNEKSGILAKGTDELKGNYAINREVRYEVRSSDYDSNADFSYLLAEPMIYMNNLDRPYFTAVQSNFVAMAENGAIGRSALGRQMSTERFRLDGVSTQLEEELFTIVNEANLVRHGSGIVRGTQAEVTDALAQIVDQNPNLASQLRIIPEYELEELV